MIVWVWPPQISISTHGFVALAAISAATPRAMRPSRYSSIYFMANPRSFWGAMLIAWTPLARSGKLFFKHAHFQQQLVGTLCFFCVNTANCETDVNDHIISDAGFGNKIQ